MDNPANIRAKNIVAYINSFSTFLLLLYISPPPPKTGDKPPSEACSIIQTINNNETIICSMVSNILRTIIELSNCRCKPIRIMINGKVTVN